MTLSVKAPPRKGTATLQSTGNKVMNTFSHLERDETEKRAEDDLECSGRFRIADIPKEECVTIVVKGDKSAG